MSAIRADAEVVVVRRGHVLIITINRPEARNAVNAAVTVGVGDAMASADADPDIRCVVLTGTGSKAFCAGADLKAIARGEAIVPAEGQRAQWGFAGYVSHHISKPTIAAVNGAALGGGTELVLASDLAIASDEAIFGFPEVKRGIIAAAGGLFRLPRLIAPKRAYELIFTGDTITAQRALELDLVNEVVGVGEVLDRALELAERISVNAPLAVQASKRVAQHIVGGQIPGEAARWEQSAKERFAVHKSNDAKEGPQAFTEKRTPVWSGT